MVSNQMEPRTKQALEKLRQLLQDKATSLREVLQSDIKTMSNERSSDFADEAARAANNDIATRLAAKESEEINRLNYALTAFSKGTYGLCEVCDKPIPILRLRALPYASCCVKCKAELEKNGGDRDPGEGRRIKERPKLPPDAWVHDPGLDDFLNDVE